MKFWKRTALCLALCAALLTGCVPAADTASSAAPTDPLTGQEQLWPGQRPVAVSIENASDSTTQWGLSAASVVLEARTELQGSTRLCLVYPSVNAVPQVGPVAAGVISGAVYGLVIRLAASGRPAGDPRPARRRAVRPELS